MTAYKPEYSAKNEERRKAKYKIISLNIEKAYYEKEVVPAADRAGQPIQAYIKQAIADRIEKEKRD